MKEDTKFSPDLLKRVHFNEEDAQDISGPSLTYVQDVWRRLKKNKLSILGLFLVILIVFLALFGQFLTKHSYSMQTLSLSNLPPFLKCYDIGEENLVYIHKEYTLFEVTKGGEVLQRYEPTKDQPTMRAREYEIGGKKIKLDYSGAVKVTALEKKGDMEAARKIEKVTLSANGKKLDLSKTKTVWNRTYMFVTD